MYDNESYANTDIQLSGSTPYGAYTTFSPAGKVKRIMHKRWKKNMAGMMAAGHPECRYVATVCPTYAVDMMNRSARRSPRRPNIHPLARSLPERLGLRPDVFP